MSIAQPTMAVDEPSAHRSEKKYHDGSLQQSGIAFEIIDVSTLPSTPCAVTLNGRLVVDDLGGQDVSQSVIE